RFCVSNRWKDQVLLYDSDWKPAGAIPVGRRPGPMTIGPDGRLWVGNRGSWDVSVVDLGADREVGRAWIVSRPEDLGATATAVVVQTHGGAALERLHGVPLIRDAQVDIRNVVTSIDPATLATTDLFVDRGADYAGLRAACGLVAIAGAASGTVHVHRD